MAQELKLDTTLITPHCSRRHLLKLGGVTTAAVLTPTFTWAHRSSTQGHERALAFYHTHTGERLRTVYWAQGAYIDDGLDEINRILRDHRADEVTRIDPRLLDLLYAIQNRLHTRQPFHVISGYRSPETNASLRRRGIGVAKNSLHMRGKAIDIRVPDHASKQVRRVALALRGGGVGYYPRSNFIHVDTGRVRRW